MNLLLIYLTVPFNRVAALNRSFAVLEEGHYVCVSWHYMFSLAVMRGK